MNVNAKTPLRRLLAMLLCVAMLAGFAIPAFATETEDALPNHATTVPNDSNSDIVLRKGAALQDDGTYTISLEAYATGEVADYVKPVDLVLVLDQSASMYTPMGLSDKIDNTQLHDPTKMSDSVVWYDTAGFKAKFNSTEKDPSNGLTFAEKVQQLGYIIAQSKGGSRAYAGNKVCTHTADFDGDKIIGGYYQDGNKLSNKDTDDCIKFLSIKASNPNDNRVKNKSCSHTHDWFVVQYEPDAAKPWKFYRANDTSSPSQDSGTKGFDNVVSHEAKITEYESIDGFAKAGFNFYVTQYGALFDSITAFAQGLKNSDADHRLAVTGFANALYSSDYRDGTGIYVNGNYTLYSKDYRKANTIPEGDEIFAADQIPKSTYEAALVNVRKNYGSVLNSLKAVKSDYYGTCQDAGFDIALKTLNYATPVDSDIDAVGREKVVVLFTDGVPSGTTKSSIVRKAAELKAKGYTVYTICTSTLAEDGVAFMKYSSSDYPDATDYTVTGNQIASPTYFKRVSNAQQMLDEFMGIVNDVGGTTVTLDANTILQDTISDTFTLPADLIESFENSVDLETFLDKYVKAYTAVYTGTEFNDPESFADAELTMAKNEDGTYSIQVKNFDYAANYVSTNGRGDNPDDLFYGKKLILTIDGVRATDKAFTGEVICTNGADSGIYSGDQFMDAFGAPHTLLATKTYVTDYAKPMTLKSSEWCSKLIGINDEMYIPGTTGQDGKFTPNAKGPIDTSYGKFEMNADKNIIFTPKTMQWNGAASVYTLGEWIADDKPEAVTSGDNLWTKINVIPANNIYYEDDFATKDKDGKDTGLVGIEYSGTWHVENTDGTNTENSENNENGAFGGVHGWEDNLANDTGDSDGSVHWADANENNTASATATFTFTGKGVDIYSRTNGETGTVYATLKGTVNGTNISKRLIVDTVSESGDYYQIPTLSFMDLEHGTYTVTIKVTKGAAEAPNGNGGIGRFLYYLDGIRVYNPIKEDEVVKDAYGEEGINAVFTEVRDILIDANSFGEVGLDENNDKISGAVFIDKMPNGGLGKPTEEVLGVYMDYGPKNEVYLAKGQAIAFKVANTAAHYYVGLKAPDIDDTGTTSVTVTNGAINNAIPITHSTDMYYEVVPVNGYIIIANTGAAEFADEVTVGDGLLSVTKIRTTDANVQTLELEAVTETEVLEAMAAFADAEVTKTFQIIENEVELEGPKVLDEETEPVEVTITQAKKKATVLFTFAVENLFKSLVEWFR